MNLGYTTTGGQNNIFVLFVSQPIIIYDLVVDVFIIFYNLINFIDIFFIKELKNADLSPQ